MTQYFLITGLPRSRTAWMAAACSAGGSVCLHEPCAALPRWDAVFESVWHQSELAFAGIADHLLGFHLPEIMERAAPRTLVIDRPAAEAKASMRRLGYDADLFCDLLADALRFDHPLVRRVAYSDLADSGAVRSCLQWLFPGEPVDRWRIERMQRVNIQGDPVAASVAAGRARGREADYLPAHVLARLRAA